MNIIRTLLFLMLMAPAKQFLNLGGAKQPGFTHVVTSPPGKMFFISGQGDAAADGTMPPDFPTRYLNMANPPAATLVEVKLGAGLLLEVEAIAIVP